MVWHCMQIVSLYSTLTNSADPDQIHRIWCLIKICTVCLNYRKLRVKWNVVKSLLWTIFPAYNSETIDPPILSVLWLVWGCPIWNYDQVCSKTELGGGKCNWRNFNPSHTKQNCSRQHSNFFFFFFFLSFFQKIRLGNVKPYFLWKITKNKMMSAAVVVSTLRVNCLLIA